MQAPRRRLVWALTLVVLTGLLLALWIAVTDTTKPLELLVGGGCALLAALATLGAGIEGRVRMRPRARWVLRLAWTPWWIVRDSAIVLGALLGHLLLRRPLHGRMVVVDFPTEGDTPLDMTRRAFAYGAGSAGPNLIVVDGADGVLVCHQLVERDDVAPLRVVGEG
jgi:hypothetical protein